MNVVFERDDVVLVRTPGGARVGRVIMARPGMYRVRLSTDGSELTVTADDVMAPYSEPAEYGGGASFDEYDPEPVLRRRA